VAADQRDANCAGINGDVANQDDQEAVVLADEESRRRKGRRTSCSKARQGSTKTRKAPSGAVHESSFLNGLWVEDDLGGSCLGLDCSCPVIPPCPVTAVPIQPSRNPHEFGRKPRIPSFWKMPANKLDKVAAARPPAGRDISNSGPADSVRSAFLCVYNGPTTNRTCTTASRRRVRLSRRHGRATGPRKNLSYPHICRAGCDTSACRFNP